MTATSVTQPGWVIAGPGGGGALYHPTVSPFDPGIVLTSCDMTCSFITLDGGENWTELNLRDVAHSFAFDPKRPHVLYAGSTGLFRSVDGGRKWRLVFPKPSAILSRSFTGDHAEETVTSSDNWPGGEVSAIAIDPQDSKILFIGVQSGAETGIYVSNNAGERWRLLGRLEGGGFCRIFPTHAGGVIAFTGREAARFGGALWKKSPLSMPGGREILDLSYAGGKDCLPVLFAATGSRWEDGAFRSGLYRSADCAATWAEQSGGLNRDLEAGEYRMIDRVAACATDANIVYASVKEPFGTDTRYFGILKSTDSGKSWDWALRMDKAQPTNREVGWVEMDYDTCWGGAPFWMGVAPGDADICYATDWGTVYRTADGGATWKQLYTRKQPDGSFRSRGIDVTNVYDMAFDPFDGAHVLLPCTDIGLMASQDCGRGWKHAQAGVPGSWSNSCYFTLFDPDVKGQIWSAWANCHDLPRQKMLHGGWPNKYVGGVCKSDDGAESWRAANAGMPGSCLVTHMVLDPASKPGNRTLYAAAFGLGVFKSADDGMTWQKMNRGIGGNRNAWKLFLRPSGSLYLLVAGSTAGGIAQDGALYCSDDGAENWRELPLPGGVFYANDMEFDPDAPGRLYLACWGNEHGCPERRGGLHVSEDSGLTWKCILDDSLHVYGITMLPGNQRALYAAAYEGRVMRSDNGGSTWQDLEGIDFKWPKKVQTDPNEAGMIYVTTFGSCAWHGPAQGAPREFGLVKVD